MRPVFTEMVESYMSGIGARLFGHDKARPTELHGSRLDTDNWGGSTLTQHHTFLVRYRPDEDRHLDMHVDECDVGRLRGANVARGFAFCGNHA